MFISTSKIRYAGLTWSLSLNGCLYLISILGKACSKDSRMDIKIGICYDKIGLCA